MITTRNASLELRKDGEILPASSIELFSREAGAYLEATLSQKAAIEDGDMIEAYYLDGTGSEALLATLAVFQVPRMDSDIRIFASDPYRTGLKEIVPTAAWRKATAKEIAEDVFSACDVEDYDLAAFGDIKLPHFSYRLQNGWTVLRSLIAAVNSMNGSSFVILPSPKGMLQIGEIDDLVSGYEAIEIADDEIIRGGRSRVDVHLIGVIYGQKVKVEGKERTVTSSVMTASADERKTVICLA